jgi:hypothetical protein
MKKIGYLALFSAGILMTACGGEEKKDEKKTCKTPNDVEANCEDVEALKKIEKLSDGLKTYSPNDGISCAEYISQNEAAIKELEPLMKNLENIVKADPDMKDEYSVSKIFDVMSDMEMCNNMIADMAALEIETSWADNDVVVNVKNGTENVIAYIGGNMKYLDADGNVLAEDKVGLYSFHFDSELKDGLPVGFEGTSDHGINCDKDKRGSIATVTLEVTQIRYPTKDEL